MGARLGLAPQYLGRGLGFVLTKGNASDGEWPEMEVAGARENASVDGPRKARLPCMVQG